MPLVSVVIVLIIIGVALWAINRYIPMDATMKHILNIVVIVVVVLWLLGLFGVLPNVANIRVGK